MLTSDAGCIMYYYNDTMLPGLIHSAAGMAAFARKIRRTVEALDATLVTDPEEWPKFEKAPEYYS